jgi:hypothetical protein
MKDNTYMKRKFICLLTAVLLFCAAASPQDVMGPKHNAAGKLLLPENYRQWIFLSAGLGMTYTPVAGTGAENPPFQNVFVSRPGYEGFLKTGLWPDKTMFVLEIRASESRASETNASINRGGHYQAGIAAVEAEVKEGGKWTFYAFGRDGTQADALPRTEQCYSCHSENGAVDNTFVQFYPTLLPVARAKGTFKVRAQAVRAEDK